MRSWVILVGMVMANRATAAPCDWTMRGATQTCTIDYTDTAGAETRTFRVRIPTTFSPGAPLVLWLHGAPGGETDCDATRWPQQSDGTGAVLVCPRGGLPINNGYSWNAGVVSSPDDIEWIRQLVGHVETNLGTDPARVFVTGFSAGGWMTHALGIGLSDRITAIGVEAGSVFARNGATVPILPATIAPISVIQLQGTNDGTIPYCGAASSVAVVASQDQTFDYWSGPQGDNCATTSPTGPLCSNGAINPIDEKHGSGCAWGTAVQFYRLIGADHEFYGVDMNIPPGDTTQPYNPLFDTTTGLDTVDIMWRFFVAHPRTPPVMIDAGVTSDASGSASPGPGGCSTSQPGSLATVLIGLVILGRRRDRSR